MSPTEFHYQVPWRVAGLQPGAHASSQSGGGYEFAGHVSLLDAPDPRRFDVRASLRDPFGQLRVRVFKQRSALTVYAIADLSASMGFSGRWRKLDVLADFVTALAYSSYRSGDTFGFIGCDHQVREDLLQTPTLARAAGPALAAKLRSWQANGSDVEGLLRASELLTRSRSLIFLLSDFHFASEFLGRVLATLAPHHVVPVVLWDPAEFDELPGFGIVELDDPETGQRRTVLMRSSVRERIQMRFKEHHKELLRCCAGHGCRPLFLSNGFDADTVTRYFHG